MNASVRFEDLLRKHWGATGKGFSALVNSVRDKLTDDLWKDLRHFSRVRNNAAHKIEFAVPPDLSEQCESIKQRLAWGSKSAAKLAFWKKITLFFQQHPAPNEEPSSPERRQTYREELTDCFDENLDDYG